MNIDTVRWRDVNFYPYFTPPRGKACVAINFLRRKCKMPFLSEEAFRLLYDKPLADFDLDEAEEVETWVDPETLRYRHTWKEIESFEGNRKFYFGLYNDMFDHLFRIGKGKGIEYEQEGQVFHYKQDVAHLIWGKELNIKIASWFIISCVLAWPCHSLYNLVVDDSMRTKAWKLVVDTGVVFYDYIFPIAVGISSMLWLFDRTLHFFHKKE